MQKSIKIFVVAGFVLAVFVLFGHEYAAAEKQRIQKPEPGRIEDCKKSGGKWDYNAQGWGGSGGMTVGYVVEGKCICPSGTDIYIGYSSFHCRKKPKQLCEGTMESLCVDSGGKFIGGSDGSHCECPNGSVYCLIFGSKTLAFRRFF